jgi:ribosomal protein L3 glutamine methyltransferase
MGRHTVASLIEAVCHQFDSQALSYGHGTDNAWDEAVALVLGITGVADDQASLQMTVSAEDAQACLDICQRRIDTRQPLAYLLGRCRYMGHEFVIQPGVVIPRSPLGYLLSEGLEPWLPGRVQRVLDLCSGSGCLGILAALRFPDAEVTLVELSDTAAAVASENIQRYGLSHRVELCLADVTGPLDFVHRFDLIVSNPPYVDAADMRTLPAEYCAEPELGLAAGADGLSVIGPLIERLSDWLTAEGLFVGEVGASAGALLTRYPHMPFIWPDLPLGGEGVFLLEAAALTSHTAAADGDVPS